jgi:hypothetical protein
LRKKTTSKLNPEDYKFLQRLLPLFSTDVTRINNLVGFVKRKGIVYYFNYQMPIYHHREDDIASFKVFMCQMYLQGNATQPQIRRAFGLAPKEMNRWLKKYKKEGPGAFYKTRAGEMTSKNIQSQLKEVFWGIWRFVIHWKSEF